MSQVTNTKKVSARRRNREQGELRSKTTSAKKKDNTTESNEVEENEPRGHIYNA